jgi:Leucine-rich repeat (LRR) protein
MFDTTLPRPDLASILKAAISVLVLVPLMACGSDSPTDGGDPLSIGTADLADGVVGAAYSETLVANGGGGGHTWSVTAGTLPAGLVLTGSSGVIAGTPTTNGSQTFSVQVVSTDGQTATQPLTIAVDPQPVLLPTELCSANPSYAIVTFDEPGIEEAVRDALAAPVEPLTCQLVANATEVTSEAEGIVSLAGMQNLVGLLSIHLEENDIVDIGPLGALSMLAEADLELNSIVDLTPLAGLSSLATLNLEDNSIVDLSPLSGLSSLRYLELEANSISDLSPLSGLTGLLNLGLDHNDLVDISALSPLTNLLELSMDHNLVTDISVIGGMTQLVKLDIDWNDITDVSALSSLSNVVNMEADGNSISDISPIAGMTSIEDMDLDSNPFSDITVLSGLTRLFYLGLSSTGVSDIQPLLDNAGLGTGDTVDLTNTSVSCDDGALLSAQGMTVLGLNCAPVLLSPAPGAVLDNGCTLQANSIIWAFDWEDVPGATLYGIFIQKTGFNALRDLSDLPGSSYQYNSASGYTPDTNLTGWFWRVRAQVNGIWSDWSEERGFVIEPVNTDC